MSSHAWAVVQTGLFKTWLAQPLVDYVFRPNIERSIFYIGLFNTQTQGRRWHFPYSKGSSIDHFLSIVRSMKHVHIHHFALSTVGHIWLPHNYTGERMNYAKIYNQLETAASAMSHVPKICRYILYVREDAGFYGPLQLSPVSTLVFRNCRPFGGVSDKIAWGRRYSMISMTNEKFLEFTTNKKRHCGSPEMILKRVLRNYK